MRGRISTTVIALATAIAITATSGIAAIISARDCSPGALQFVGSVSESQIEVHTRALLNRFSSDCHPETQGLIVLHSAGDADIVQQALQRAVDSLNRRVLLYGLDRPLSAPEKSQIESDSVRQGAAVSPFLQMPLWVEGIGIGFRLSCHTGNPGDELKLTSTALSQIFSGQITQWNDPLLVAVNPGLGGPSLLSAGPAQVPDLSGLGCKQPINVSVRSDPSSKTSVLKDYLSHRNPHWGALKQDQFNTAWPPTLLNPCRGLGDSGVADCILGNPGAIGYVGYAAAARLGLRLASIENASGQFVKPKLDQFTLAASVGTYPPSAASDWSSSTITDGPAGYPICFLQFADAFQLPGAAYANQVAFANAQTLIDYLLTALSSDGQTRLERYAVAQVPSLGTSSRPSLREISELGAKSIIPTDTIRPN